MLPGGQVKVETSVNESGATKTIADKWALVVGISNFEDPTINLKFAAKDATDFANYLSQTAGFKKDHIRLLTNDAATREGIIQSMGTKWLGRLAAPDDLVVVYVSSHGSPANDDTGVNFLVAHDTDKKQSGLHRYTTTMAQQNDPGASPLQPRGPHPRCLPQCGSNRW
jgi:hypothetical protein